MTEPKWLPMNDGGFTRIINSRIYTIYRNTPKTWRYFSSGKVSTKDYNSLDSIKRAIRKLTEKERKHNSKSTKVSKFTASNLKWVLNDSPESYLLKVNDRFYRISKTKSGLVQLSVTEKDGRVCRYPLDYDSVENAMDAANRFISGLSPNVTNEPIRNIPEYNSIAWVKGVPQKPGSYFVYTSLNKKKRNILVCTNGIYRTWYDNTGLRLDETSITHYISLDNINPP